MLTIAVDGYSSSGKGAVCTKLAEKLGVIHFDTGAIYRLVGYHVKKNNIDPYDRGAVENSLNDINVTLEHDNGEQITILNGEDISQKIRKAGGRTPNAKKRTSEDDKRLKKNLLFLIKSNLK